MSIWALVSLNKQAFEAIFDKYDLFDNMKTTIVDKMLSGHLTYVHCENELNNYIDQMYIVNRQLEFVKIMHGMYFTLEVCHNSRYVAINIGNASVFDSNAHALLRHFTSR